MSVLEQVKNAPMSRAQIRTVVLCLTMNLLDGFDLLATSFVGPVIGKEWGLSSSKVGVLLSSGLAGMAFGALCVAPLADRLGRRRLTLASLVMAALGMLGASASQNFDQLLACRVLTGTAVGVMAACLPVLASESASHKRRGLVVALITTGYGLGSVSAGLLAYFFVVPFGWRFVFLVGGIATALLFVVGLRLLPESMDYLIASRPRDALAKLNRMLVAMGHPRVEELPEKTVSANAAVKSLFYRRNALRTVLIWVALTAAMTAFYFASSWTPALLLKAGLSAKQGIFGGVLFGLGGVSGAVALALLVSRLETRRLTAAYFAVAALALVLFSTTLGSLAGALVAAAFVGFFLNGSVSGLNVIVPGMYPAESRTTALGMAVAVSRLGAVFAPTLAGYLLDAGWAPESMFRFFALPALVGAVATAFLVVGERVRSKAEAPLHATAVN
ncbi:benzoate transport [Streptomyces sp. SAI-135]|uniref:MFS transporter n=1 Tax=unclassified Streptomyces TaxID=2593676 RepID=UPI0024765A7A|nr:MULTISPECIES: MFS transporter [unclassified Streptomyces]MDH6523015.1 benzoate transport [Streptomyces sp. SAI-090]MDH6554632.1 benzoate transport [Streptomyces sp. SAI-041]MDH6573898.1 benzoate transport [Streptomyces sp. SAI-117]MDH6581366.1 benzoate transport [Streptomyces sp. SAI-133]MDH6613372.1 benzoate transport [Streptomyces sp. SAI-135]